ncbi:hypothetical protein GCM10010470_05140 [Saccharopolyspora taberi]|uniref:Uncharacterized protein n=1 Tax=Saccharopolyspora taberi TaxID=60895 RepID=A0ABN3V3H3_9PSEU
MAQEDAPKRASWKEAPASNRAPVNLAVPSKLALIAQPGAGQAEVAADQVDDGLALSTPDSSSRMKLMLPDGAAAVGRKRRTGQRAAGNGDDRIVLFLIFANAWSKSDQIRDADC